MIDVPGMVAQRAGSGVASYSFAVRRLLLWHEHGEDISQKMLALSTYLGHAKVSNTYWYLSGVPELMGLAGQRFEEFAALWEEGDE